MGSAPPLRRTGERQRQRALVRAVFTAFTRLGLTSFGGPSAHIGYFHRAFVSGRGWLSEARFAEGLGLAQFLPGPASSQLGLFIGLSRGGVPGALAAFAGFTLPSALIMGLAGGLALHLPERGPLAGALAGLILVALAIVAQAVAGMARSLCPDTQRRILALLALIALVLFPQTAVQMAVIAGAALTGALLSQATTTGGATEPAPPQSLVLGLGLGAFGLLLALLPLARPYLAAGALVFGGGHVVLPLLHESLGAAVGDATFFAGYGLAQAMPGPLFTFATYLGAAQAGLWGAVVATLAIFAPGFALLTLALPLWARLRRFARLRGAVAGVNAAVVGLLGAAWVSQLAPHGVESLPAGAISILLLLLVFLTKLPPVALVALGAGLGAVLL
ncbi:chromate transporter [Rhodobacter aestuarii]|uniref:Chromate transporter n=1 Tax=Rhodobacter aestuarii TaxID=453582 RepID=A0A1N7IVE3_9RHOB|nr:chromate transporter [Rhodobacter aestuarii]SIS41062.1 chromate transporter [Rhodobacter aestuarii]